MSPDHYRIIKYPLPVHLHQALSPPPPGRTCLVAAYTLCLSANRPACACQLPMHIRLGHVPCFLVLPAWHRTILFARKQHIWRPAHAGAQGVDTEQGGALICYLIPPACSDIVFNLDALTCLIPVPNLDRRSGLTGTLSDIFQGENNRISQFANFIFSNMHFF